MLKQSIGFIGALFILLVRIIYLPFALVSALSIILSQWRVIIVLLLFGGASIVAGLYIGPIASEAFFVMQCRINVYYNDFLKPILNGIIREFVNRIVCSYDAVIYFPYGFGRDVVFPVLRQGGFGPTVSAFNRFLSQIGRDAFKNYFFTTLWLTQPLDFTNIYTRWAEFVTLWQNLWCYGCNDLCPYYTKLPVIPSMFTSDQIKDPQWMCFWGNSFNGGMAAFQQIIYLMREIIWPTVTPIPAANFRKSIDFWCAASACFWRSWENALQNVWDYFIPFNFIWRDVLCVFDSITCVNLKTFNLFLNLLINARQVFNNFANIDRTYWTTTVKRDYIEIINSWGPATYFQPIVAPIQNTSQSMTITSYQLLTSQQGTPWGTLNPIYLNRTAGECLCIALTRLICDPNATGVTCAQTFNGTLLSTVDPCCASNALGTLISDWNAGMFEFTLHLFSFNDFILYLDKQPFSTQLKDNLNFLFSCLYQIFRSISKYGFCLEKVLSELTSLLFSTMELNYRLFISLLTLPYYQAFLPQTCNFVSCPGDMALNMSLAYLDRITNSTNPDGLINCMCFILNNGFNVPFAGCRNVTCVPTGYVNPTVMSKRFHGSRQMFPEHPRITPIMNYGGAAPGSIQFGLKDLANIPPDVYYYLDKKLQGFGDSMQCSAKEHEKRLIYMNITTPQINCTDPMNPPPCFNLCCFPASLIKLMANSIATTARALNSAFQTRFTDGSAYWDGKGCGTSTGCFAQDIANQVALSTAPLTCLCQFTKLLLPPTFKDPCCIFTVAGEIISVSAQIVINVGNSVAGDAPNYTYIRGNQTFNTTGTEGTGIPLVDDFTVNLSLIRTLFDCFCDFITSIFTVAFSGFQQFKAFDPCCMQRVYLRAILEGTRTLLRLILALTQLDTIPAQQFLYVNGYKNARPFCPFSVGGTGLVLAAKNITTILLAPPVKRDAIFGCAASINLDMYTPDQEGLPTCICTLVSSILAMVNAIDENFKGNLTAKPRCMVNLCCGIFSYGKALKGVADFAIELIATIWQNWEFKAQFKVAPQLPGVDIYIPQETINFLFCNEYDGILPTDQFLSDGVTPNPYYSASYLSLGMTQIFYAPFVANKPNYTTGFIPNNSTNATTGVINANSVYDPNNPQLRLAKCGKIEPILAQIQNLIGNCLCMNGTTAADVMTQGAGGGYTPWMNAGSNVATCSLNNMNANGVANMVDNILRWLLAFVTKAAQIFPKQLIWPNCLCCGGQGNKAGMIVPFANMYVVGVRQLVELIRNIPNPTYWTMNGGSLIDNVGGGAAQPTQQGFIITGLNSDLDDVRRTWINRFLAPFADAACTFITNSGCLLEMILGNTCESQRYSMIASVNRYIFEAYIQYIALIEGFIKLFAHEQPGQCIGNPVSINGNAGYQGPGLSSQGAEGPYQEMIATCSPTSGIIGGFSWRGIDSDKLGRVAVSTLTFVVDALIGQADLSCSALCARQSTRENACNCLNLSPYIAWGGPSDIVIRCHAVWYYFYQVDGWNTMYFAKGYTSYVLGIPFQNGNPNYYPPGSAGSPSGCVGPCNWESINCGKDIPGYGSPTAICGEVCVIWFREVWCAQFNFTLNPFPGDKYACVDALLGLSDTFTGQSMTSHYSGKEIWKYTSEMSCTGATVNYCKANVNGTDMFPTPFGPVTGGRIIRTIIATPSLSARVPILIPTNTTYDPRICDNPNFAGNYGTQVAYPLSSLSISECAFQPNNTQCLQTPFPITGNFEGSCNWYETQCKQPKIFQKIKYLYGWLQMLQRNTGFSGVNPFSACCQLHAGFTSIAQWELFLNLTLPANATTEQIAAIVGPSAVSCFTDSRYAEFAWIAPAIGGCPQPDGNRARTYASVVTQLMRVWLRNCRYTGVNAYSIDHLTGDLLFAAANQAASECYGVPSSLVTSTPPSTLNLVNLLTRLCILGGNAGSGTNFNIYLAVQNLENTAGASFSDLLQANTLLLGVGRCAICRLQATGCIVTGLRDKTYQPVCDRKSCLAQGWCKNDMMVPCSALDNPAILDGGVVAILKYFNCLMSRMFGTDSGVSVIFDIVLKLFRFLWQIMGGIIRLVVAVLMVALNIMVTFLNDLTGGALDFLLNAVLGPLKIAIIVFQNFAAIFNAFAAIFQQPLVSRAFEPIANGINYARTYYPPMQSLFGQLFSLYNFDDGHNCIEEDPVHCFCRVLDMHEFCRVVGYTVIPSGLSIQQVLNYVKDHYKGTTSCDMLWDHLANMQITNWTAVPYAERFQAIECITQRSKGESFNRVWGDMFPVDFFYNPRAMFQAIINVVGKTTRHVVRDHQRITKDTFQEKFKMSRDMFYKAINLRSYKVQDYYRKVLRIDPRSPVYQPLLELDVYYFKYRSGYYHMLWDNMTFWDHFGNHEERMENLRDRIHDLKTITSNVITELQEEVVEPLRDHFVPNIEMPQFFRMIYEGSLWQHIRSMQFFPSLETISVTMDPWELEPISVLPVANWTPEIEYNWEVGRRFLHKFAHIVWPHHTTKEVHDRFVVNGNCRLYDGAVVLGTTLVDYCLNDFVENTPTAKSFLGDYLARTSHMRHRSFFNDYKGQIEYVADPGSGYRRPKIITTTKNVEERYTYNRKHYQRMTNADLGGFAQIFLDFVDRIFGIDLLQTLDNFITDFTNWVNNPNVDPALYPNVGAKYWFSFMIRCDFKTNLTCAIGIRLKDALWKVGLIYIIVFALLAISFPSLISLLSVLINIIVYLLIVAIVAWHYSPACIALFPSTELYPGFTVPIFPVPLTVLPTIPMCMWDDIIDLLGSIFASCYTWIPEWMLNTAQCVTCDNKLGFFNCADVGLINPWDVTIYWGYYIFGATFCDLAQTVASALSFIPGAVSTTSTTCFAIKTASPTQQSRQTFCALLGIGSLGFIGLILFALGVLLFTVVLALINILHALVLLLPYLLVSDLLDGRTNKPQGLFVVESEGLDPEETTEQEIIIKPQKETSKKIGRKLLSWFTPHMKTE